MSDLSDLYQEIIVDHGRHPRNRREIAGAAGRAEGYNPLCGDHVTVYLDFDKGTINDASFTGSACAICTASASLMTERLRGGAREEARAQFKRFRAMLTGENPPELDTLGELAALSGVRRFPMRVKCATLPWHTMLAALEGKAEPVSTE